MAAPDGSVTWPRRSPAAACAGAKLVNSSNEKNMMKRPTYLSTFIPGSTSPTNCLRPYNETIDADGGTCELHQLLTKSIAPAHRHQRARPNSRATTSLPDS